jgi:hypothetical protein
VYSEYSEYSECTVYSEYSECTVYSEYSECTVYSEYSECNGTLGVYRALLAHSEQRIARPAVFRESPV